MCLNVPNCNGAGVIEQLRQRLGCKMGVDFMEAYSSDESEL
jgi:hypothetical protein